LTILESWKWSTSPTTCTTPWTKSETIFKSDQTRSYQRIFFMKKKDNHTGIEWCQSQTNFKLPISLPQIIKIQQCHKKYNPCWTIGHVKIHQPPTPTHLTHSPWDALQYRHARHGYGSDLTWPKLVRLMCAPLAINDPLSRAVGCVHAR